MQLTAVSESMAAHLVANADCNAEYVPRCEVRLNVRASSIWESLAGYSSCRFAIRSIRHVELSDLTRDYTVRCVVARWTVSAVSEF